MIGQAVDTGLLLAAYTHNAFSDRAVWEISLGLVKHSLQVCLDCDWGQEREEGLLCGDSRWGEEARRGGLTSRQGADAPPRRSFRLFRHFVQ